MIQVWIDDTRLAESIAGSLSIEEIVSLIAEVDRLYSDWDLTKAIYKWAKNEMKEKPRP